jgi:hypothetical protein
MDRLLRTVSDSHHTVRTIFENDLKNYKTKKFTMLLFQKLKNLKEILPN